MAKKSGKSGGGGGIPVWAYALCLAGFLGLAIAAAAVHPARRLVLVVVAALGGLPAGFTCNPVLAYLGDDLYRILLSAGGAAFLPQWPGGLIRLLSPSYTETTGVLVLLCVILGASALAGWRGYSVDWKVAVLMGGGGALGMYLATIALQGGELARTVFGAYFNNPWIINAVIGALSLLTLAHYVAHKGGAERHWLLAAPLAPMAGFWSFYVSYKPLSLLFFLCVFTILVVLNAGAWKTLMALPPVLLVLWLARLAFVHKTGLSAALALQGGTPHLLDMVIAAGAMGLCVFLCLRIAARLEQRNFEVVFACGLALFLLLFFASAG
jgi:hypothetical protein